MPRCARGSREGTPDGVLLRIRPQLWLEPPSGAPPLEGAFPGVEEGGVPECPKTPEGWTAGSDG